MNRASPTAESPAAQAAPARAAVAYRAWRLFALFSLCVLVGGLSAALANVHGEVGPALIAAFVVTILLAFATAYRITAPLARMAAVTRRIAAGEHDAPIAAEASRELATIANAFDTISDRLRRESGTRAALARIDAVILSSVDLDSIASIALNVMGMHATGEFRAVVLADPARNGTFAVEAIDGSGTRTSQRRRTLEESALDVLRTTPEGMVIDLARARALGLDTLGPAPEAQFLVQPILVATDVVGTLLIAYRDATRADAAGRKLVRDLADRLAVAVATSRRDDEIYRRAYYDHLTRLPNRQLFLQELSRELARAERRERPLALLLVDLDGFATLNDTLGHGSGDALLLEVSSRLRRIVRKTDLIARLGADEFAVALTDLVDPPDAARVARGVIADLGRPVEIDGADCFVTASVGIALSPGDAQEGGALLAGADMALARAKAAGGGRLVFFEETMNQEAQLRATLDRELRRAITESQFFLQYEPLVDAGTGRVDGVEALIRWQHPSRGLIPPGHFIGFAEETGLIEPIGEWVLLTACKQFVAWRAAGLDISTIAVNVSARQFQKADFADTVDATLGLTGMQPQWLKLEVTESVLIDSSGRAEHTLARLAKLGVRLALDDFGTGYSSLAYLKRLPVETIKLDRSFVRDLGASEDARSIAQSAIAMVHALRKRIVAEGVETAEQLALLRGWGCDSLQGWYFTRSLAADAFVSFVRDRNKLQLVSSAAA